MYLPGTVAAHLLLSVAPPPSQETHSVFRTGSPKASRYTIVSNYDNPDSGVTVPLYSYAVPHAKENERQTKPRAHVGVMWLRELIVTAIYLTEAISIFPRWVISK